MSAHVRGAAAAAWRLKYSTSFIEATGGLRCPGAMHQVIEPVWGVRGWQEALRTRVAARRPAVGRASARRKVAWPAV